MHYTRRRANREFTLYDILKLSEDDCWQILKECRFGKEEKFACPECGAIEKHWFISTRKQWHCKCCSHRFSVTSGTVWHKRKLAFSKLLCIIISFVTSAQGLSANKLPSMINITYKTAFLNLAKVREVIFETMDLTPLTGIVHIDCAHFCGKPRRGNQRKKTDSFLVNNKLRGRKDAIVPDLSVHPEPWNLEKIKKRRIVFAISQLSLNEDGSYGSNKTISLIIKSENAKIILPLIKKYVCRNAIIMTDYGNAFNQITPLLGNRHFSVNHSKEYQDEFGVNNNQAEAFFSRMRRAEFGVYNGMRHTYLAFYAAEFAFRNDTKTLSIKEKFYNLLTTLVTREPSKAFCGYSQGKRLGFEYCYD